MTILTVNSGSATLKFDLYRSDGGNSASILSGQIERIGSDPTISYTSETARKSAEPIDAASLSEAVEHAFTVISSRFPDKTPQEYLDAVGFRIVHGADRYISPTLLTEAVLRDLEDISRLAPLHNPPALAVIRTLRERIGTGVPFVGVFDTMFHASIPDAAAVYAIPRDFPAPYPVKRYGFHGLAHEYMLYRYAADRGKVPEKCTVITAQLGSGASITAVKDGHSVDTSMGYTPLEGLIMRTRPGDLDPGILLSALEQDAGNANALSDILNRQSGLAGMTGTDGDMRTILAMSRDNQTARTAVAAFAYRVKKYIGAYLAALNGAEAILIGGGIGEHAPRIRADILSGLTRLGVILDERANTGLSDTGGRITTEDSRVHAYVIPVDESERIAAHVRETLPTLPPADP